MIYANLVMELQTSGECVCDWGIACAKHPNASCPACEYACCCPDHQTLDCDCGDPLWGHLTPDGEAPDLDRPLDAELFGLASY